MSDLEIEIQYWFLGLVFTKPIENICKSIYSYSTLNDCPGLNPAAKNSVQMRSEDEKK